MWVNKKLDYILNKGFNDGPKFLDEAHKNYYLKQQEDKKLKKEEERKNKTYDKICIKCGKSYIIDYMHRFQKRCPECEIKYPPKIIRFTGLTKVSSCRKCGSEMVVKKNSTTHICKKCHDEEKERKRKLILEKPVKTNCLRCGKEIIYCKRHIKDHYSRVLCDSCKNDPFPFKKDPKYNNVMYLLENTTLTCREIEELLGLEKDYIKEAAIERHGFDWYKNRLIFIRKRSGLEHSAAMLNFYNKLRKDENKLKEHFENRIRTPSNLELLFQKNLSDCMISFEHNSWQTIKINNTFERREIDLKIPLKNTNKKFIVFVDGEAFHGPQAFFKASPVERDCNTTKAFSDLGYLTIRYSESEIKNGIAIAHFISKYKEFETRAPVYYYRNWMTKEEIVLY